MANTYYDSELTAEEIEEVLEAINDILNPANNGKVLAISNGKFEARSVQWGGGEAVLEPLSVTQNGDYTPESGVDGFDEVHVSVPNSYSASDEGKVVNNGALVAQTARSSQITQNGTYDTTLNDEVTVNVSGGGSAVIQSLSVAQNGTYTPPSGVDGYAPVTVNVSGGSTPVRPDLPSDYQEVEYITFDGKSYFNSPFPKLGIVTVDYAQTNLETASLVFGNRGNSQSPYDINLGSTGGVQRWYIRSTDYLMDLVLSNLGNNRFMAKAVNGAGWGTVNIGRYWDGNAGYPFNGKLYSFSVLRPITLEYALYLVPCYRISDDVIGFYDVVGNVFYTNQGFGQFGKGPDVN